MEKRTGRHSVTLTIPKARAGGSDEPKEKISRLECEGLRPPSCGETSFARGETSKRSNFGCFGWCAAAGCRSDKGLLLLHRRDCSFEQWYQHGQIAVDDFPENIEIDGIVAVNESIAKTDNL